MYEASAHRDDGTPSSFGFGRGLLGEGQVVLPDLVDGAGRVGQACAVFALDARELATDEDTCHQREGEGQDMQTRLTEGMILGSWTLWLLLRGC